MSLESKSQTELTNFLRKFCPKELVKNESAGFFWSQSSTLSAFYPQNVCLTKFHTHSSPVLSILFLAFQHGVSDRLSSWSEKRRQISEFPFFNTKGMSETCNSYQFSVLYSVSQIKVDFFSRKDLKKLVALFLQGKTGILACKRYGSTALSYEQVSDDTVDKRVYIVKYLINIYSAVVFT